MADEINTAGQGDGSQNYQMNRKLGAIFMLISATGMGLVPLFSRWATRTNMFDATQGLNGSDSIGAIMALGRMSMGVIFFVILMVATHKVTTFKKLKLSPANRTGWLDDRHVPGMLRHLNADDHCCKCRYVHLHRPGYLRVAGSYLP